MLTLEGLVAVISLCLTAFGLGYAIGCNHKKKINKEMQKNLTDCSFELLPVKQTIKKIKFISATR